MPTLDDELARTAAETDFSGVVRVDVPGEPPLVRAFGLADRAHGIAMTPDTRLGMASGSKTFTALAVMSLVEEGMLSLSTTARSLLGTDLPLISGDVTVEHLLAHRSGIGDYLDDDAGSGEYLMTLPVHRLATTEAFLPMLDGHATRFPAGEQFSYCNGGYVVLALLAERAAGASYHDLVRQRVLAPAGMTRTDFLRGDDLPGDAAIGYVEVDGVERSNVLHLPVLATGDGGASTTVEDVHRFWTALDAGRIVPAATVATMVAPRSPGRTSSYGLGFWVDAADDDRVQLEGADAGVSFRSSHHRTTGTTWTVVSNTSDGTWPVARAVSTALSG
ncbi:serine hydrolase domain-containing protein [Cellulomonas sp. URHB0016]